MSIVVTAALAVVVTFLVKAAYKPLEPLEESGMFVDGKPAPETIAGMKADADAVVLVTYWGQHRTLKCRRPPCLVSSVYVFETREIIKAHPALPNNSRRFELELFGGLEESPTSVTRSFVVGRRDPVRGHRYVIFARRHGDTWIPATGNAGGNMSLYDVSGERALSLSTREGDNLDPPTSRDFLAQVRNR